MEASGAGLAVAGGETQATTEGAETQGGEQFAPLLERFEQGFGEIQSRIDALSQQQGEPVADPAAEQAALEQQMQQEFADLFDGQEQGVDPAALQQVIQQAVQQAVAPVVQQTQALQIEHETRDLEARIPALKDPETAQKAFDAASQLAQRLGVHPSAALVEVAYKASLADAQAQSEVPAGGGHVALEGGGGAAPTPSDGDAAQRIVQAGGGSRQWF